MNMQSCQVFQALGDKTRLKILELIKDKEFCVSDICKHFDMTQPSISHHLDILKRAGLVKSHKKGREVYYKFLNSTIVECCCKQLSVFDLTIKTK